MNTQTGVTSTNNNTVAIASHDSTHQSVARASALNKLEQEIQDLSNLHMQSQVNQAGANASGDTTLQGLAPNMTMNPNDGPATSSLPEPTTPEEKSYRERYANSKAYYDKTITDTRAELAVAQAALANAQNPPQTAEELEALRARNPDMFKAFESMVSSNQGMTETRVRELETQLAKTRQEKAVGDVVKKHEDFYQIMSSNEWTEWKNRQPHNIQEMINGNTDDSISMIRALDLYKFDKGVASSSSMHTQNQQYANNNSSAADAVTGTQSTGVDSGGTSNKRVWTRSEIAKMSIQEYETFAEDILLAQTEGRIRDDKQTNR